MLTTQSTMSSEPPFFHASPAVSAGQSEHDAVPDEVIMPPVEINDAGEEAEAVVPEDKNEPAVALEVEAEEESKTSELQLGMSIGSPASDSVPNEAKFELPKKIMIKGKRKPNLSLTVESSDEQITESKQGDKKKIPATTQGIRSIALEA